MEVILWSVLLGFAILVTAIVVSLYYRHKYGPIFRQLSELLEDKEMVKAHKPVEPSAHESDKTTDSPAHITGQESCKETKPAEEEDDKLFKQLTDAILNEQLYTTPKFGRQDLVTRFHLTSKRISTAFSMAGTSVPEFIRECRLEHARRLIAEQPDIPLVEIATASGFVHASTFTVDFKNKYGVSPTKYREGLRAESS